MTPGYCHRVKKTESNSSTSSTSKRYPTARCRPCTSKGKQGVNTRWICDTCRIGLCSRACFESFHSDQGFEILSAARKVNIQGAPAEPQETLVHTPPVLHEVSTIEDPAFAAWRQRVESSIHFAKRQKQKKRKIQLSNVVNADIRMISE